MNGGSTIVDLRMSDVTYEAAEAEDTSMPIADFDEYEAPRGPWGAIWAGVAIVAALGWIGFMIWYAGPSLLPRPEPMALAQFAAALAAPPAWIGVLWLIARRSSKAEAQRFAKTAGAMRHEATHLQEVIEAMAHTIEANRLALGDQVTSMMAAASGMAEQIATAEQQAARLDGAARVAEEKLSVLLATLPKAHEETEALAAKVEATGLTASERAAALDAAVVALSERAKDADALTSGAAERLAAHIARMEATSETAGARLESVTGQMSEAVDGLLDRTASAVDEARKGIAAQGDAMLAMLSTNQATLDRTGTDSAMALAERIGRIESVAIHISDTLGESQKQADALARSIDDSSGAAQRFAGESAPQLLETLLRIRDTANAAAEHAREAMARIAPDAADALEAAAAQGMEKSLAAIAAAAQSATASATEASDKLNAQMLAIAEASGQIEARIAETDESNGFARRVSLLIESLNSSAIDLGKIYAAEVPDSSWAAYLKGDRGAFTRRAVKLLDAGDIRAIHQAYENDDAVRAQVNRYIHDFEAMLRGVLAQRDSGPIGVTLLSSDMGKLYVALAQAIERLRT